jgi:hypothetical protein
MKTLLLIIRYLFPRKRWEIIKETKIYEKQGDARPCEEIIILRDQFGNLKLKRITS